MTAPIIMVATGRPYRGKSFPPRGNFIIPARTDYGRRIESRVGTDYLAQRIKVAVDWARMCMDHGRPDLAEHTLMSIWRMADAIERRFAPEARP